MQNTRLTIIVAGRIASDSHQGGATNSAHFRSAMRRFDLKPRAALLVAGTQQTGRLADDRLRTRALLALIAVMVSVGGHAVRAVPNQSALAAVSEQPVVDKSWPSQAYRVEWEEAHIPEEVAANVKMAVPVTVRNIGNRVWPASQVFVAYHWFRDYRLVVWDGERTRLPRDLRAGGRAALSVRVATPAEPGSYVLQLTLVHELVTWFENKSATTVIRPIAVRPPTQSVDCGISGSTQCTAAH